MYKVILAPKTVLYSLRLFVVDGGHIAIAMVVVGHICTQNVNVTWLVKCC